MEQQLQESQENKRWTKDPVYLSFKYQGNRNSFKHKRSQIFEFFLSNVLEIELQQIKSLLEKRHQKD